MFVIKKKSGKWRLLQDLRAVNAVMKDMGALQPGLPSPVAIPKGWHVTVIDLQDCFFTIKLHPADSEHFAFSVPAIITSGRGYACVFPQDADSPIWIPDRLVKPVSQPQKETHAQTQEGSGLSDEETHA